MAATDIEVIKARLATKRKFVDPFSEKERRLCRKFIDSSAGQTDSEGVDFYTSPEGDMPTDQPEGQVNFLTINTLVKKDALTISNPDFIIEGENEELNEIARDQMRKRWEKYDLADEASAAFQSQEITGHGFLWYRWSEEWNWTDFEWVMARDIAVDPHVTSTSWKNLRWAARCIHMPRDLFLERYGARGEELIGTDSLKPDEEAEPVKVWLYWDHDTEAHMYGMEEELEVGENLYGAIPLLNIYGEINPRSPWRLGTFDFAIGLQKTLSDLQDVINNEAVHGGSVTAYNPDVLDEETQNQWKNGRPQGSVSISGGNFEDAIKTFPASPISDALLRAYDLTFKGLLTTQGVTPWMLGNSFGSVEFATEIATASQQSNARILKAQRKYERLVREMAEVCQQNFLSFADPERSEDDMALLLALQQVEEIRVVEASTIFQDPVTEQQSTLQLLQLAITAVEPMAMTGSIPNLPELFMDVLRAFNKTDVQRYLIAAPMMQPGPGQPGEEPVPGESAPAEPMMEGEMSYA